MALWVKIFGKDNLSKKLRGIGKLVKGLALGFGKWDRIIRTLFIGVSVKLAADMQKGLREIGTLMGGLTDVEMKNMSHELQIVAARSGEAMKPLLKARYDIVSAGFVTVSDSLRLLNQSAELALAGNTDIAKSADLLTTTINAYGLSVDDATSVSDKLFTIVRLGKTTMTELGGSMGRVLAIAGQFGISLDEIGAAMAALTVQGQSTEEATTAIRSAIIELLKPQEALADLIAETEFKTIDALIAAKGFAEGLNFIKETADKAGIKMKDLIGNVRSMQAILPLTGTAAVAFSKGLDAMGDSAGATARAAEEMRKSFVIQLDMLKASVANIMTEIGNVLIKAIQPKVEEVNRIFETLGEIGWDKIGEFMAANWSIILGKLGEIAWIGAQIIGLKFKQGIEAILTPEWWDKFVRAFKVSLGLMTGNIVLIRNLWQASTDDMAVKVDELILKLQSLVTEGFDFVVKGAEKLADTPEAFTTAWFEAAEDFKEMNQVIVDVVEETTNKVKKSWSETINDFKEKYKEQLAVAQQIVNAVGNIHTQFSNLRRQQLQNELNAEIDAVLVSTKTEEEKQAAISNLREEYRKKEEKALKKLKIIKLAVAISNVALAVTEALPNFILAGLIAVAGAAEVAVIAASPYQFGGRVPEIKGFQFGGSSKDTVPAMLTPHEMVSTPEAAGMFGNEITRFNQMAESGFGGGGGDRFEITINALDGADVERVIKRNPNSFARGFKDLKRRRFID